jgi:hypothetical protein
MKELIKYIISFTPAIVVILLMVAIGDIAFVGLSEIYSKSTCCCFGETIIFWFSAIFSIAIYIIVSVFLISFAVFIAKDIRKEL